MRNLRLAHLRCGRTLVRGTLDPDWLTWFLPDQVRLPVLPSEHDAEHLGQLRGANRGESCARTHP